MHQKATHVSRVQLIFENSSRIQRLTKRLGRHFCVTHPLLVRHVLNIETRILDVSKFIMTVRGTYLRF